jgi:FkbM family methyltransferase
VEKNELLSSYLNETIIYFRLKMAGKNIEEHSYRFQRAMVLRYLLSRLHKAMEQVNYRQKLLITPNNDYIVSEGVFLNMKNTSQYLKIAGENPLNEGKIMYDFLKSKGVEVNTMIDIGANWGEISLYFAMKNPQAKILAIDGSTSNFEILKSNCQIQNFSVKNIILINEAVGNKKGTVKITKGLRAENTIVESYFDKNESENVPCDTLDSIIKRYELTKIDFIKIDIEGAEPLLFESLKKNIGKIRAITTEIGDKTARQNYLPLITFLWESKMECYERLQNTPINSLETLKKRVLSDVADLWFIKKI